MSRGERRPKTWKTELEPREKTSLMFYHMFFLMLCMIMHSQPLAVLRMECMPRGEGRRAIKAQKYKDDFTFIVHSNYTVQTILTSERGSVK
jgi:hypothetical protein